MEKQGVARAAAEARETVVGALGEVERGGAGRERQGLEYAQLEKVLAWIGTTRQGWLLVSLARDFY